MSLEVRFLACLLAVVLADFLAVGLPVLFLFCMMKSHPHFTTVF